MAWRTCSHGSGAGGSAAYRFGLNSVMPTARPGPAAGIGVSAASGLGVAETVGVGVGVLWTRWLLLLLRERNRDHHEGGHAGEKRSGAAASTPTRLVRGMYGGATPQPQRGTGASGTGSALGCEFSTASRVPHSA